MELPNIRSSYIQGRGLNLTRISIYTFDLSISNEKARQRWVNLICLPKCFSYYLFVNDMKYKFCIQITLLNWNLLLQFIYSFSLSLVVAAKWQSKVSRTAKLFLLQKFVFIFYCLFIKRYFICIMCNNQIFLYFLCKIYSSIFIFFRLVEDLMLTFFMHYIFMRDQFLTKLKNMLLQIFPITFQTMTSSLSI